MGADEAVQLATILVSIGTGLHAMEVLALRRELATGGLYSWDVFRTFHRATLQSPASHVFDSLFAFRPYVSLVCTQLAASVMVALQPASREAR